MIRCSKPHPAQIPAPNRERVELEEAMAENSGKQVAERQQAFVKVSRSDVDQLITEIMQVKEFLPKVLNSEVFSLYSKLESCERDLEVSEAENKRLKSELEQLKCGYERDMEVLKKKNDSLLEESERHMEEKYKLKCQLLETNQQMGDQSEYCSSMGAAVCTLLWRVSRQQESITSLLGGNKADEFLQITSRTVESYFETYSEDATKETSDECQFVLALTGTVTNMAAAAEGRDFLVSRESGLALIDSFITVLCVSTVNKNVKLRNLMLMALYNISINFSGMQYIMKKGGIMEHLIHTIKVENDSDLKLNAARLIHSIVMEPNCVPSHVLDAVPLPSLQNLARAAKGELREILTEVLSDLQSYHNNF
ncbi:heat shock factor 2-binding protein-like [Acropora millepora]|uniref:heat shock factor 2-binding protein-like n=1 Tax=Acropora millepora TaxID=45264 RepID=UPI001CF59F1F|nr:heat shock factor 2-binding protein-like [Acropora millepora]